MTKPFALPLLALLAACAGTPSAPPAAIADLAPGGTLRAVINLGNPILAKKDPAASEPAGVSVDLARAADTAFTGPYVLIEGAYLVRNESPIRANEEVDRNGIRVAVGLRSAYDLYLTRTLKQAKIERAPTSPAVVDYFIANRLEVAAGVKQQLEMDARRVPGLRLLPGRFMVINQAMGMRPGREAGAQYLRAFVEEMKASGFVAQALRRHSVEGAAVAPPGGAP